MTGYREHAPCRALRAFVQCYWSRRIDAGGQAHRVLPDGAIDLVFDLSISERGSGYAVGTMTRPLLVPGSRGDDFLGVRFRPGRAGAFLRLDAEELTDGRVELGALWGGRGERLVQALLAASGTEARLRILERELVSRLDSAGRRDPYVDAVVEEAIRRNGALDLSDMERSTGVSGAWLRRGFRRHVGTGPKFFCRVVRLQAVLARARRQEDPRWAELALEYAFSDQAHLAREFRTLSGLAPTRFLVDR